MCHAIQEISHNLHALFLICYLNAYLIPMCHNFHGWINFQHIHYFPIPILHPYYYNKKELNIRRSARLFIVVKKPEPSFFSSNSTSRVPTLFLSSHRKSNCTSTELVSNIFLVVENLDTEMSPCNIILIFWIGHDFIRNTMCTFPCFER